MAPSSKSKDPWARKPSKDTEGDRAPSLNLWVGGLSPDIVDSDLIKVFKDYGAMDALTSYVPSIYAFVFFRTFEEAKKARDELQGKVIKGVPIRIEFARTAKPGKHLWVGGLSPSVTEELLEDELLQYGKLEDYKFMRDRDSALVGYYNLDDAIKAQRNINGKSLGGQLVRADFQKPQYPNKDLPEHINPRSSWSIVPRDAWIAPDEIRSFKDLPNQGSKRHMLRPSQPSQLHGGRRDGPPSNTLWIGYPSSVHVDEQMLHNAMILFGEIENITNFPARNYSFVEFRSIDEARRAKEGLQGRLFGDPRIQILFSSSEFAPAKDSAPFHPGYRGGSRPDIYNEAPLGPLEFLGHGLPMGPNTFPGHFFHKVPEMGMSMRPYSAQGFDQRQDYSDFHEFGRSFPNFPVSKQNTPGWGRHSPPPGVRAFSLGMRRSPSFMQGEWDDGFDMREAKRSRVNGSPINDARFHGRRVGGELMGDGLLPRPERVFLGHNHSPVVRGAGHLQESSDIDLCWRGVIAKGGSPVCHARCVPIGKGLESPLPEVVNCFARTDLDMLTKHYGEAIGFDIVFFLPDSEEDFASYTEFLEYLGLKNRVGVAKCDDGTTLFLVPPSDFLINVLKVSGPDRLYGVVLKLPQQPAPEMQQAQAPHYSEQHKEPSLQDYAPVTEEPVLRMDHSNVLHENSVSHSSVVLSQASELYCAPSATNGKVGNPGASPKIEVSLTPELIAALASFLPPNSQSSIIGNNNVPSSSAVTSFPSNLTAASSEPAQGWIQDSQSTFSASQLEPTAYAQQQLQQSGSQYNMQVPLMSQNPYASNLSSVPDNSVQSGIGGGQVQNFAFNMQQVSAIPSIKLDNYAIPQGQSFVPYNNQQYQHDSSFTSIYNAHGVPQASDSLAMLNQPAQQQQAPTNSQIQDQNATMLLKQMTSVSELPVQAQQQHMVPNIPAEGTSKGDTEKNLRYQQTLQFAATLIQKIQQNAQGGGHAAGGSGN